MEAAQILYPETSVERRGVQAAYEHFDQNSVEAEAWRLIQNRETLPIVEVQPAERHDNARTAIMEALTASGHLSRVEITGTLDEISNQVTNRLVNGWDDSLPWHEKQRRFAELSNELVIQKTHQSIVTGELPADTAVLEISDYPEALAGQKLGYRDSNKKGMVRSTHLIDNQDGTFTRLYEQVSRSNGNWPSTYTFMSENGIQTNQGEPDIIALKTPLIYDGNDYIDGVVDVIRRLDQHAGADVLYGDTKARSNHVPYEDLRVESARRETEVLMYVDDLAKLEAQLDNLQTKGLTKTEADVVFKEEVDRILTVICTLEPDYAEDTFGKRAAPHFHQAADMVARGEHLQAQQLLEATSYLKEEVTFCGVSISIEKANELGLEVNSYGELTEKGKESWKWKQGICQVESCPTRPGKTEVGPCSVCRKCQAEFDKGRDPTKQKTLK
ncbi:MAG TPA: hypothetical protein VLF39_04515 [Candidatus Saccharimonadales bacterium]|nr:hypothetical protein [Candidatus Saccharimonadales bacterium]